MINNHHHQAAINHQEAADHSEMETEMTPVGHHTDHHHSHPKVEAAAEEEAGAEAEAPEDQEIMAQDFPCDHLQPIPRRPTT